MGSVYAQVTKEPLNTVWGLELICAVPDSVQLLTDPEKAQRAGCS